MTIYDAAMKYKDAGVPLIVLAGKEYGSGSSRDWAAKGTLLLGVKAVIAESFERIHRSNLVNMGVLPLQFPAGQSPATLGLTRSRAVRGRPASPTACVRAARSPCARKTSAAEDGRVQRAGANRHARGTRRVQARRHSSVRASAARREVVVGTGISRSFGRPAVAGRDENADSAGDQGEGASSSASISAGSRRRRPSRARHSSANGSLAATPARWRTWRVPPSSAPTSARVLPSARSVIVDRPPSTTPIGRTRPSAPIPRARTSRGTPGATTTTT